MIPTVLTSRLRVFLRFSRPHTILGTTFSITGLYLMAYAHSGAELMYLDRFFLALLSCLGANIYIVGLNQLTDVAIDRINKPQLPVASGAYTPQTARRIVSTALAVAVAIALTQGPYLALTVLLSLLIGTVYSLPPFRLKRFHFWAAFCIFAVRGIIVNLFGFLHFYTLLGGSAAIPAHIWALTAFMFGLSLVIAWFKDIPDMSGDRAFKIITLSLKLGPHVVFRTGVSLLLIFYLALMTATALGLPGVPSRFMILSHLLLALLMLARAHRTDPADKIQMTRFYLFTWVLFFAEYFVFAAAGLLA